MSLTVFKRPARSARRQLRFGYAVLVFALASTLGLFPTYGAANTASALTKQGFITQLGRWLAAHPHAQGSAQGIYDNRFTVPECAEGFSFAFHDQHRRTVTAQCASAAWQRHIRLRKEKHAHSVARDYQSVYELQRSVAAEEPVTHNVLKKVKKLSRHVAQNALTDLPRDQFFAARNLRKGQMLVAADVYTAQYVAIADKTIPMGHPITTDLFRLQKVTSRVPNDAVTDLSGLEHLAANRLIHQKSILRKRDLKKAKLVQRGEQLILSAGSQNYSIETIAVALQDGYFGDQIRLKNLASNQEVRAVVSGINRAKALR